MTAVASGREETRLLRLLEKVFAKGPETLEALANDITEVSENFPQEDEAHLQGFVDQLRACARSMRVRALH